ncbi:TIR domain-containing protein [Clostridium perfringens]
MYYQILIETNEKIGKSKANKVITDIDIIDKKEIINDVLVPYLVNNEFTVNGYILTKKEISRLKIMTTEKSVRELSKYENDNMPSGVIMYVSPQDILDYDKYTTDVTKKLLDETKKILDGELIEKKDNIPKLNKGQVFIVHGHDNEAKIEVARFVERLGLEAIILHEQVNDVMTIIEKIDRYSNVGFAIVLYTPCDIGYPKEEESLKKFRARQNVVFEHGYLISKIGRNNVCALVKQDIEIPNDISGVVYINMDEHYGWKLPLAKEMKSSGYDIDFNLVI